MNKIGRWLLSRLIARRLHGYLEDGESFTIAWEHLQGSPPGFVLRYEIDKQPLLHSAWPRFIGENVFKALYRVRGALIRARAEAEDSLGNVPF